MVIGMVRMIAKAFYRLVVEIQLEEEEITESSPLPYHYTLAIEMVEGRKDCGAIGSMSFVFACLMLFPCQLKVLSFSPRTQD